MLRLPKNGTPIALGRRMFAPSCAAAIVEPRPIVPNPGAPLFGGLSCAVCSTPSTRVRDPVGMISVSIVGFVLFRLIVLLLPAEIHAVSPGPGTPLVQFAGFVHR